MLNALVTTFAPCGTRADRNFLTRSPVDLALALYFVRVSLFHRSLSAAPARMLTLDGRPPSSDFALTRSVETPADKLTPAHRFLRNDMPS